jgi:hypothetical protein
LLADESAHQRLSETAFENESTYEKLGNRQPFRLLDPGASLLALKELSHGAEFIIS